MKSRLMAKLASSSARMSASAASVRMRSIEALISPTLSKESISCSERLGPSRNSKARLSSSEEGAPGLPFTPASGLALEADKVSEKPFLWHGRSGGQIRGDRVQLGHVPVERERLGAPLVLEHVHLRARAGERVLQFLGSGGIFELELQIETDGSGLLAGTFEDGTDPIALEDRRHLLRGGTRLLDLPDVPLARPEP